MSEEYTKLKDHYDNKYYTKCYKLVEKAKKINESEFHSMLGHILENGLFSVQNVKSGLACFRHVATSKSTEVNFILGHFQHLGKYVMINKS